MEQEQENNNKENIEQEQNKNQEQQQNQDLKTDEKLLEFQLSNEQIQEDKNDQQQQQLSPKNLSEQQNSQQQQQQQQQQDQIQQENFQQESNNNAEAQQQQEQSQVKQRRRTRNDNSDRNFTCGCGKAYLSYPALYTHLKQKHEGKAPEGTQLPQNPSKAVKQGKSKVDEGEAQKDQSFYNPYQIDVIDDLLNYLDTLGKECRRNVVKQDESIIQEVKEIQDIYTVGLFEENEETLEWKNIHQYLKEDFSYDNQQQLQQGDEIRQVCINRIIAHFIKELNKVLNDSIMKEAIFLMCLFRKALNEYGYMAGGEDLEQYMEEQGMEQGGQFCEYCLGDFVLQIVNDFLIELLPQYVKQSYERLCFGFQLIGQNDQKIKNAVFFIYHFADWMFLHHYTNTKLVFKMDNLNDFDGQQNQEELEQNNENTNNNIQENNNNEDTNMEQEPEQLEQLNELQQQQSNNNQEQEQQQIEQEIEQNNGGQQ